MTFKSRVAAVVIGCFALTSTIVGRTFTGLVPGEWDAQLFAYVGFQWLHGSLPYVQVWDNKPPGIYTVAMLAFSLFHKSFAALAFMEGVFILGCIGTVYLLMRQWGAPVIVVWLSTGLASVTCNLQVFNEHGNLTEIYLLWPATLSMYFFSKSFPRFQARWVLLAGFSSGVATLFKPVGLSPLLAQGAFVLLEVAAFRRLSFRESIAHFLTSVAGFLAAWAPIIFYFGRRNALGELVAAILVDPVKLGTTRQGGVLFICRVLASNLQPLASVVLCAAIGAVLYVFTMASLKQGPESEERSKASPCIFWPLALLWVFFDLCGALAGGGGYPHYFLCLAPSLSVAAGLTYWHLIQKVPEDIGFRRVRGSIFVLILGPLLFAQALDVAEVLRLTVLKERPRSSPWHEVANYLNAMRQPSDRLFVWNYIPGIYFETGMKSATRHMFALNFLKYPKLYGKLGEEMLHDLIQAPPRFIVDVGRNAGLRSPSESIYREKFLVFLENQYVQIYSADEVNLYEHRGQALK